MASIQKQCKWCHQTSTEVSRKQTGSFWLVRLSCKHSIIEKVIEIKDVYAEIESESGHKLYPYQIDGVKRLENANGKGLLSLKMGGGKTVIALSFLRLHPEAFPAVIVVRKSLLTQWFRELQEWCDGRLAQIISDGKDRVNPRYKVFIVTYDLVGKMDWSKVNPHTVLFDECQALKSTVAKRTKAAQELVAMESVRYIIPISGTPIKNSASEYWPVLNMLRPSTFPTQEGFIRQWCDVIPHGNSSKVGGIARWCQKQWNELTKEFVIRYTEEEMNLDLPELRRSYRYNDLSEDVKAAYERNLNELTEVMDDIGEGNASFQQMGMILQYINMMRHLTGLSKVEDVVDYMDDFTDALDNEEPQKIILFHHHKDVGEILMRKLEKMCREKNLPAPLQYSANLSLDQRDEVIKKFKNGSCILVASTLAMGEGVDGLQGVCNTCIMVERQWNPSNEEQAEGRLRRIGATGKFIESVYFVALGTIDEFFTELVEKKRGFLASTLDGKQVSFHENDVMMEIAQILTQKGKKKWRLM